jgi:hypothetical protein
MAWTAPMTFKDGNVLTAAQMNLFVRDNFMETMPAKVTGVGKYCVVDRNNHIVQRDIGRKEINTREACTKDGEYGDLTTPGPSVVRTTGPTCLVWWGCQMSPTVTTSPGRGFMALSVSRTGIEEDEDGTDGIEDVVEASDRVSFVNRTNTTASTGEHHRGATFFLFHGLGGDDVDDSEDGLTGFEYQFSIKYRCTDNDVDFHRRQLIVMPLS